MTANSSIPLHCNTCPKQPNFSDVSHLLTHISSKGHLSNYYKLKVRSNNEDTSRRVVEAYDRWYTEWNVETLMSERMNQKDKRRTRPRPAGTYFAPLGSQKTASNNAVAIARATQASKIEAPAPRSARPRAAFGHLLDPRLSEQQMIKVEISATPTPPPQSGPVLRHRPFAPYMQYWPSESRASSHSYSNQDYETSSEYSDPSERKRYQYTAEDSCAIEDDPVDAVPERPVATSECTKLKGVYWPGMDLFDSATPEMRRKRNQKKDSSVVQQLELNSYEVEPTELIFTPQGSFKKQRRISGSVYDDEESSPIKAESPRSYLSRPALVEMDANAGRRPRHLPHPPPHPFRSRNQYNDHHSRSDHSHGYGNRAPKRKRAFDVFQDNEVSFAQPAAFSYLTAAFQRQPSPSPSPAFSLLKSSSDPFHHDNKENAMPTLQQPAYEQYQHQTPGFHYPAYAYGLGHDHHVYQYQYHNPLFMNNTHQPHNNEDADDQRTLTAPPSPSTGET